MVVPSPVFQLFRIRSVVRDATTASRLAGAIAACTHVHRTGRASNVNSHNCDCNPESQKTVVDETRCVEMLTIVVVLVPKGTSNGST